MGGGISMIGSQIGNYQILEKLGEGGMGVVYKAVDINLDRTVAIKALNTQLAGNPELEQRFRNEAKAQANLNHTNLATLYALLIEDGRPWMVMEFIEGETFEQMVQRRGPIPSEEAIPLFRQALLGIGYAHRMGIVHRDIKPSNMMLNKQGIVKVMDFGIAKVMGARGMTKTGTQMGTAFYMSPEQVLNKSVDIRSDIYSLGVTLYEMLTANVPFSGDSDYQIMTDHVSTPPPLPTRFYPYIPAGVQNAVLQSLEKSPDARFQTVEEFGAALEQPEKFSAAAVVIPAAGARTVVDTTAVVPAQNVVLSQNIVVPPTKTPFFTPEKKLIAATLAVFGVLGAAYIAVRPSPKPNGLPPAPLTGGAGSPLQQSGEVLKEYAKTPSPAGNKQGGSQQQGSQQQGSQQQTSQQQQSSRQQASQQASQQQASQQQASQQQASQQQASQQSSVPPPSGGDSNAPVTSGLVVPAGTLITVRMIDTVDSSRSRPGQQFQASLDAPIVLGGRVVVPQGANARVVLASLNLAGHIEGRSDIKLALVSISVHGVPVVVRSSLFEKQGISRGKTSAVVIGGGAAVGAAIGGIFGHKKGAAVGAASGAGVGTGAQLATKGPPVTIPSETRIDFRLRSPLTLSR